MGSKREITAAAEAMFEVVRWYDEFGRKRDEPLHKEWSQCPKDLKDAFRRVARAGLKAAAAVGAN